MMVSYSSACPSNPLKHKEGMILVIAVLGKNIKSVVLTKTGGKR